jgi:hypothetical protein
MTASQQCAWKEVRALAPLWVVSCLAIAANPWWHAFRLDPIGVMAYMFGTAALGAHAFGHEYGDRTLGGLLAQPMARTRILAIKLGVVAVMLIALTAVASVGPYSPIRLFPSQATFDSRILFLPTLMGLTLAPYLALVARSTLGGAVFTIAVPGMLLVTSDVLGVWLYGAAQAGEIDRFKFAVFPPATVVACVLAAVAIWPAVLRLEVPGDGAGPLDHVALPALGGAAARRQRTARSPYRLLAAKELRLQQITFVVVALYVCAWATGMWMQRSAATAIFLPWWSLNMLYAGLLALLVGALASAEERQIGMVEWQSLLPMAAWKQFAVKVTVVLGLTWFAGIVLPAALAQLAPLPHLAGFPRGAFWPMWPLTAVIAAAGLYVSTVSSSAVRAMATAVPVIAGSVVLFQSVQVLLGRTAQAGLISRHVFASWGPRSDAQGQALLGVLLVTVGAVCLVHAYRNHAGIDHGPRRLVGQAASLGAAVVTASVVLFMMGGR